MDIAIIESALLLISCIVVTVLLVPLVKRIAIKVDAIDYPSGRRINKEPIPRLGGAAIFGGIAIPLLVLTLIVNLKLVASPFSPHPILQIDWTLAAAGVAWMFIVGILDDIYNLSPGVKLIGQIAASSIVALSGIMLETIGTPMMEGQIELGIWAYPVTIIYLVAFANIINLIDGLDGLSSGITIIATATIMVFAFMHMRSDVLILGGSLIGACIGFLKFNRHPASIFMGDSGSLVLGLMLGILSLVAIARSTLFTALLVPILASGVPIIDTASAIIRRKASGQPIAKADRGHIHHRLLDKGYTQDKVVALMLLWTLFLAAGSICITLVRGWLRYAIFVVLIVISLIIVFKLGLLKPVIEHVYNPRLSKRHIEDGTFSSEEVEAAQKSRTDMFEKIQPKDRK